MSKKPPAPPPAPKAPDPQSERYYEDGFLRSERIYDPTFQGYNTRSFSTPEERGIQNQATGFINQLVGQVPGVFDLSQDSINQYKEAYAAPQRRALEESYNKATGQANLAAGAAGLKNSVGFEKFRANELERNKAQGLADIAANAELMGYDLPRKMLAPYADAFNLVNAALSGEQANTIANLEPAFQGSQAGSSAALGSHTGNLNAYQLNQQNQRNRGGGFFSNLLFGGF